MTGQLLRNANQSIVDGDADRAIEMLNASMQGYQQQAEYWTLLGFAYHAEQREPEAAGAFEKARQLQPDDAELAMLHGQSLFHSGYCAISAFANAKRIQPHNLNAIRGYAMAIAAAGESQQASDLLSETLLQHLDWLEGHKLLSTIRYVNGDTAHYTDSYQKACQQRPSDLPLRLAWLHAVMQQKNWALAKKIIADGEKRFATSAEFELARLLIASESCDDELAAKLFAKTEGIDDVARDMAQIRFCIRTGQLTKAEQIGMQRVAKSSARSFIPYLDIIWRLQGADYWHWLNGEDGYVRTFDIQLSADEWQQLGQLTHRLHTAKHPFAEQSVRGGTQTDQNLFLRHEPIIRQLREQVTAAVAEYVNQLPPSEPTHPLLGVPRAHAASGRLQFSGSWSVKLQAQGHNVSHNHPLGWISSALYVQLPSDSDMGQAPAGYLQFGQVPAELGLDLPPFQQVRPEVGKIVLFPSTQWHATVPFEQGERVAIAFDVKPGRH